MDNITIIQTAQEKYFDSWKEYEEISEEIIHQINTARKDPKKLIEKTDDQNTINFLRNHPAVKPLSDNPYLKKAAIDHYRDIASNGVQSHTGSDSTSYSDRIEKYAQWGGAIYESIVYKFSIPEIGKKQDVA